MSSDWKTTWKCKKDQIGLVVPDECEKAFTGRKHVMDALAALRVKMARIIETQSTAPEATARINWEAVHKQVIDLHDNVMALLPFAVCQNCANSKLFKDTKQFDPRCVCRGYGWLTETEYRMLHKRKEFRAPEGEPEVVGGEDHGRE